MCARAVAPDKCLENSVACSRFGIHTIQSLSGKLSPSSKQVRHAKCLTSYLLLVVHFTFTA